MNKDFSSLVICSSWLASEFGGHSELRWIEGWSFSKVVRVFSRQVLKGKNEEVRMNIYYYLNGDISTYFLELKFLK